VKIAVGSKNPVKVQATKNILEKIFSEQNIDGNIEIIPKNVDSEVSDQPVGMEQTIEGAVNRAKNAFSEDVTLSVGIESGLMETPQTITGFIDLQWCAVHDGEKTTLGVSAGFEYPPHVIKEVLQGREVGHVMDQLTGIDELGKKTGAVSYLSNGLLDRLGNTEQCVLMAMIPLINNELYFND